MVKKNTTTRRRRRTAKKRVPPKINPLLRKLLWAVAIIGVIGLVYLDSLVRSSFYIKNWQQPIQVYARPLEIYPRAATTIDNVAHKLQLMGYQKSTSADIGTFYTSGNTLHVHTRGFQFVDGQDHTKQVAIRFRQKKISAIYDKANKSLSLLRIDAPRIGGVLPHEQKDRILMQLNDVPPLLIDALLSVEDKNFFHHYGISWRGIARALYVNITSAAIVQGGSTLTQQLVKNFWFTHQRQWYRKVIETVTALLLELHFDKEQILTAYINQVYLGQDGGRAIHGFALASQFYFNLPIAQLSLPQSALLIGLIKGPSLYNPWRNPHKAIHRRNIVLHALWRDQVITKEQMDASLSAGLGLPPRDQQIQQPSLYLDLIRRQIVHDYPQRSLDEKELRVMSNYDPLEQHRVQLAIRRTLAQLEVDFPHDSIDKIQVAAVVASISNGEILALVGGRNPHYAGFNRALDARRPIGSLIKPAVYLTALNKGYHLASPLEDSSFTVTLNNQRSWQPQNIHGENYGVVLMYESLMRSLNLSTVRLGLTLTLPAIIETLHQFDIHDVPFVPSLLLGAIDMTPVEVASFYHIIANNGFRIPLRSIRTLSDSSGHTLLHYPLQGKRVASVQAIYILRYALWYVMKYGTGRSLYWKLPPSIKMAGKTGTSDGQRDSWAVGFSGDKLAVFWLGFDDNRETPLTGSRGAMRILAEWAANTELASIDFSPPPGITLIHIDKRNGLRTQPHCPRALLLPFQDNKIPTRISPCQSN